MAIKIEAATRLKVTSGHDPYEGTDEYDPTQTEEEFEPTGRTGKAADKTEGAEPEWLKDMTKERRTAYFKEHPTSKYNLKK